MNLSGVFAPIPTPFDGDGAVDAGRLRTALARFAARPLAGFIILGSNGEAVLLDEDESDRVIAAAREAVPKGRPFIVGTGRESTQAAVRAAKRAAELGADAVLVRTPGFFKTQMTSDAFVRHYTAVADASPVPGAAVQLHGADRREPAAGGGLAPGDASQHHRHEGIGRRHRADRGSGVGHARGFQRPRRLGVDVLRGAGGRLRPAASSRSAASCRRRACGCSSW